MRIAFIVGGFPMISETFILNQITGLINLGHEVDIFARRPSPDRAVHPEVERYGLLARTHWFDLPRTRWGRVKRATAAFLRAFPRHPIALLRCLNLPRYGSVYAVLNNVMHALPFLEGRYEAVMCHYGGNGADFIFLKDLLPGLKFVTMFHKGDIQLGDERTPAVYRHLPAQGDAFLAISESWSRPKLLEFGFDARRIRRHPIGVNTRQIEFRAREPRGAHLGILTVARLHTEKGIEHGLRAVAGLIARRPRVQVCYRIVGDGEDHELLEAQATGLPVLATDVGGVRDIVPPGAGFVVPAADPDALTDKLALLADHPERWPEMGRVGRRFVEEQHDIVDLDARLAALFEQLVGGRVA